MREIHDVKKVPEFNMTRRDSYNDLFQAVDGAILLYCVFIFSMTIFYHMMLEYAKWSSFKESLLKKSRVISYESYDMTSTLTVENLEK